ncbi:sulfatase family protein [Ochrovirga pacifica]|nr:sulfatase-like hydrolase/transferase [Ochrovirga pacifica]
MKLNIKYQLLALFISISAFSQNNKKPNIVFILTDDQSSIPINKPHSAGESRPFGFNGDKYVHTPIIDELAKNGMIFSNATVSTPVCSASRYSILTGRYAGRSKGSVFMKLHPKGKMTRVENNVELEEDQDNLAKLLQKAGYKTGFVGKSHIIDHNLLHKQEKQLPPFKSYDKKANPKDPEVNKAIHHNHEIWCKRIQDFGFDYANGVYAANLRELFNDSINVHNVEWKNKAALDFIDQVDKEEPFFLYYSETIPHGPAPWIRRGGKYPYGLDSNPSFNGEGYDNNDYSYLPSRDKIKEEVKRLNKDVDHAWLTWFDYAVGAVVKKLKEKGVYENTLIVITSDHGNFDYEKATLYEGGLEVPLAMHWPNGIKPNSTYDGMVQNIDFTPTFLELAGVTKVKDSIDGLSLTNVLAGKEKKEIRDYLFFEIGLARGVRTKDWKYIAVRYDEASQRIVDSGKMFKGYKGHDHKLPHYVRNGHLGYYGAKDHPLYFDKNQLFNRVTDPEETKNLYNINSKKADEMKKKLLEKLVTFPDRPFGEFINKMKK